MHYKKAKSILTASGGMNVYRGCSHGCIYCDSRSKCYSMDHDFEDIEVKINAPELLESRLKRKREKSMIGTGGMCDPYMHVEDKLQITRQCLEIISKYGFGASVLTKSDKVLRDLDILKHINSRTRVVVQMTLTTYDEELCKIIEPHVSTTKERVDALKVFRDNGIETVVWLGPILPFINDSEANLRGLLDYCIEAGVSAILCFGMGLTLREGNREYFYEKLDEFFPGLKEKYHRKYGYSYGINSDNNKRLMKIFRDVCEEHHIIHKTKEVFEFMHRFEDKEAKRQISLFDS